MIKLATETIDKNDIKKLIAWLKTYPKLTQGKLTQKFEKKFAKWLGTKYAIFCNSGSSANLLMLSSLLQANIIKKNSKVVVPAICWSTDVAPIFQLNLNPLLCDINLENLSLDLSHLEQIYKREKPDVLFLVSILGFSSDIKNILKLSKKYNVKIIEDNCESVGSKFDNKKLGNFGLMSSFSTFFGHHFSTIEGGIITTNDKRIFNILKMLRSHGWDRDLEFKEKKKLRKFWKINDFDALYTFYYSGYNLRSTNLQAFIGLNQLKKLNRFCKIREKNFNYYQKKIVNNYWKIKPIKNSFVSNFGYPLISPYKNEIVKELTKQKIQVRPLISGSMNKQPFFRKNIKIKPFKASSEVDKFGMYLPNHHDLSFKQIDLICNIVNKIINNK